MSNKQKTIKAAARLFHEQGFRDTSVDQITAASNISKSNFYYHFKSKESLGYDVLDSWVEGFRDQMLGKILMDEAVLPDQRIRNCFTALINLVENRGGRYGCPFGNMALELSDVHEGFRTRLAGFFDQWAEAVRSCLEQGKLEGIWSDELESGKMGHFVIAAAEGAIMLTKTHRRVNLLQEGLDLIFRLLESYRYDLR